MSTVGTVNIWTKNVTKVSNEFLSLIQVSPMKQMKTQVLNLKKGKTHIPIGYLTLNIIQNYTILYLVKIFQL